jgi:hypothetical protein
MSIIELGALGEFVASFGVIAMLVFLTLQVCQNTKALRLSTSHAVTGELQDMFSLVASNEGLAQVMTEAARKPHLQVPTRVRYTTYTSNLLRVHENAYLLRHENSISQAHWNGITRMMIDYTSMAAFPEYWNDRKHWFSDDFQSYMDAEIVPTPPKPGIRIPGDL